MSENFELNHTPELTPEEEAAKVELYRQRESEAMHKAEALVAERIDTQDLEGEDRWNAMVQLMNELMAADPQANHFICEHISRQITYEKIKTAEDEFVERYGKYTYPINTKH